MQPIPQISDGELAVLRLLWSRGAQTSRDIMELLYPDCSVSDHATVHSLLKRLEAKRLVARDRDTHPHVFSATIGQSEFAGRQLSRLAAKVSDGSLAPFLSHLIESNSLSADQLDELRNLLAKHKDNSGGRNRKRATRKVHKKQTRQTRDQNK